MELFLHYYFNMQCSLAKLIRVQEDISIYLFSLERVQVQERICMKHQQSFETANIQRQKDFDILAFQTHCLALRFILSLNSHLVCSYLLSADVAT